MTRQDAKLRAARLFAAPDRMGHALCRRSGELRYEVGYYGRGSSKFVRLGCGATWEIAFSDAEKRELAAQPAKVLA